MIESICRRISFIKNHWIRFGILFQFYIFIIFVVLALKNNFVFAKSISLPVQEASSIFGNHYPNYQDHFRSHWPVLLTFVLPGFDQFVEGQIIDGSFYAGYALLGLNISASALDRLASSPGQSDISTRNNDQRQALLGSQMYQEAGALSAYQTFRSTIEYERKMNFGYQFIKSEDTSGDIMLAPLKFSFLARPTTYLPLGILLMGMIYSVDHEPSAAHFITGSDIGYLTGLSYQAGTSEEALFRGIFMPDLRNWWGSDFWSNIAQATVFSLAHISTDNPVPVWQFAAGYYWGWLAQKNKWSIQEGVFIHAWWDVIAFTASYLSDSKSNTNFYAPLFSAQFE